MNKDDNNAQDKKPNVIFSIVKAVTMTTLCAASSQNDF
jgi:hypothetical protein